MTNKDSAEDLISDAASEVAQVGDIDALRQALAEEKARAEGYLANWQRAQADYINYKRRSEQEKEEAGKFANTTLILNLLPALDDLDRALDAVPPRLEPGWVEGIRLIERKLQASLEALGLSQIKAFEEPFDPHLHEAVRQAKGKEGMIIEEVQKGYKFHDRVIRPARVVVGNGEEEED